MPTTIRKANIRDLNDLVLIERLVFSSEKYHLLSKKQFRYLLIKSKAILLVAIKNNEIVGYSAIFFRKNSYIARLYSIAIRPEHQGGIIGKDLYLASEDVAKKNNCHFFSQEIRQDNIKLKQRYLKIDFEIIKILTHYYPDGMAGIKLKKKLKNES